MHELQDTVSKMRGDQVILKISSYRLKNETLNHYEQIELIYNDSPVPVYCLGTVETVSGFLGGCLADYHEQAVLACQKAKDILNGADISKMKVGYNLPGKNMVNYQALLKYHLPVNSLPKDIILLGAPSKRLNIRKDVFFIIVFRLSLH